MIPLLIGLDALIVWVVVFALLWVSVTQVIIPLWNDLPLFPLLRRQGTLEHRRALAHGEIEEATLEVDIHGALERAENIRKTLIPPDPPPAPPEGGTDDGQSSNGPKVRVVHKRTGRGT